MHHLPPEKPQKRKKLVLFGDRVFAQLAYEYFTYDSEYEVVAFTVDKDYLEQTTLCGLPVIAYETLQEYYPSESHEIFVALAYGEINRRRAAICDRVKTDGYTLASYVSSKAFVWYNVEIGENCFIFEDNTIQPFVTIGNNVILWSGNHIGHHSVIEDNCFISSHVAVAGFCTVGANSFLGVNASVGDQLTIGKECWLGQGAVIQKDLPEVSLVKATQSVVQALNLPKLFTYLARRTKRA